MEREQLSWQERGQLWLRLIIRLVLAAAAVVLVAKLGPPLLSLFAPFVAALIVAALLNPAVRWLQRRLGWSLAAAAVVLVAKLGPPLLSLFAPFVAALIVAALLNPAVRWLQRRLGWSRKLLSLLLVVVIFGVIGGCLGILTYAAANELVSLAQNWSGMLTQVEGFFDQMEALFARAMDLLPLSVVGTVEDTVNALIQRLQAVDPTALLSAAKAATDWAMRVPEFLLALVVFVMASYFLTADYPYHRTRAVQHLDESLLRFLQQVKATALAAFGGYLRAELLLSVGLAAAAVVLVAKLGPPLLSLFAPFVAALIVAALLNPAVRWLQRRLGWSRKLLSLLLVGVFFSLLGGFLLVGQNYALLLALGLAILDFIPAILDFIPIIGSGTVMVPWAVVALFTRDFSTAVYLMVIWGVVAMFRRVAEPRFVGDQTGLSPILSLVGIYVGMKVAGVAGMILGPILILV